MKRFSTSRLLSVERDHSETTLMECVALLGLQVGRAELDVARSLLGVELPALLEPAAAPTLVVDTWSGIMRIMGRREQRDTVPLLLSLAAIGHKLVRDAPRLREALLRRGWNEERTASEAAMRLFSTEFNMGRSLVRGRGSRAAGRALLTEAVATSAHIRVRSHGEHGERRYHGMRGVAFLLLARGEFSPSTLPMLEAATYELSQSRL